MCSWQADLQIRSIKNFEFALKKMPPKKHVEVESSSNNDDDLRGTITELSVNVNQLSVMMGNDGSNVRHSCKD